jgi:hypothetical protein
LRESRPARGYLAATLAFALLPVTPAHGEVWRPTLLPDDSDQMVVTLDDGSAFSGAASMIVKTVPFGPNGESSGYGSECESFGTPGCNFTGAEVGYSSLILPICEAASDIFCLEDFLIGPNQDSLVSGVLQTPVSGHRVPASRKLGTPSGELPHHFLSEHLNGAGAGNYVVSPRVIFDLRDGKATPIDLQLSVHAINVESRPGKTPVFFGVQSPTKGPAVEGNADVQCRIVDTDICGQIVDFSTNTVIKVSVRVSNQLQGWLKGRLTNPVISSSSNGPRGQVFTIQGEPVTVPKFEVTLQKDDPLIVDGDGLSGVTSGSGSYSAFRSDSAYGVKFVSELAELAGNKAGGSESVWYISTASTEAGLLRECTENAAEFVGLVTTNAMAFDGGVPAFGGGFLSYNLAGTHYVSDGKTLSRGSYDLAIRSDVARCLYGYSRAPISATISVLGESGQESVAVTQVSEKGGWLTLNASNFTFSEKEIKVRFSQSQVRTLSDHPGRATALTAKQKAEIRAVLAKGKGNTKFICTGIRLEGQSVSMNRAVRLRAKLACEYAKSLDPKLSTFYQSKVTKARSFQGRVLVVSK